MIDKSKWEQVLAIPYDPLAEPAQTHMLELEIGGAAGLRWDYTFTFNFNQVLLCVFVQKEYVSNSSLQKSLFKLKLKYGEQ